jgi:hypothetical protein
MASHRPTQFDASLSIASLRLILRDAFVETMKDPGFLAEIEKRKYELDPAPGENLEAIVKDVMSQPPAIIERLKVILAAK